MTTITTPSSLALAPSLETAWQDVDSSFERFCLTAGIGAIEQMLCEDAQQLAGAPHNRGGGRVGSPVGRISTARTQEPLPAFRSAPSEAIDAKSVAARQRTNGKRQSPSLADDGAWPR